MAEDRKLLQSLFIRTCRDAGFKMDGVQAATITARAIGCSPLEIWTAFSSLDVMDAIAAGKHPAAHQEP